MCEWDPTRYQLSTRLTYLTFCFSFCYSDGPVQLRREVVLLTEDRNLRLKAHTCNVPVRDVISFMRWSRISSWPFFLPMSSNYLLCVAISGLAHLSFTRPFIHSFIKLFIQTFIHLYSQFLINYPSIDLSIHSLILTSVHLVISFSFHVFTNLIHLADLYQFCLSFAPSSICIVISLSIIPSIHAFILLLWFTWIFTGSFCHPFRPCGHYLRSSKSLQKFICFDNQMFSHSIKNLITFKIFMDLLHLLVFMAAIVIYS